MRSFSCVVVATALLLATTLIANAAAKPTNISTNDSEKAVTESVEKPAVDSSNATSSGPDNDKPNPTEIIKKEFKPSFELKPIVEAVPQKKGRILLNRKLPVYQSVVRKFDKNSPETQLNQDYPSVSILKLFDTTADNEKQNETSLLPTSPYQGSPEVLDHPEPVRQKLYYGDVLRSSHQQPTAVYTGHLPSSLHPAPHHQQVNQHSYGGPAIVDKELEHHYYYPKNLMSKLAKPHLREETVPHHGKFQGHVQTQHPLPYSSSQHEPAHSIDSHTSGHDYGVDDYRIHGGLGVHGVHGLHNPIGPVLGRALQILIPSALFITGASALFPTRVHVPTNDIPPQREFIQRHKRSPQFAAMSSMMPGEYDVIPSEYLRREHRAADDDEEGIILYDDEDYLDPSASTEASKNKTKDVKIPPFKFMPPSAIPDYLTSSEEVTTVPKRLTMYPVYKGQAVSTLTPQTTAVPNTRKMTPQEAMSQLLMATFSVTHPTDSTFSKFSNKTVAPTTSKKISPLPKPVSDSQSEASNEKPFFRQPSSERPKMNDMSVPRKYTSSSNRIDTITSKPVTRRGSSSTTKGAPVKRSNPVTITAKILRGHGPQIIELGGNDTDSRLNALERKSQALDNITSTNEISDEPDIDLAPDSPVVGLITNFAARDQDSPQCQKRALCELAVRGSRENATKFERFLWNLASLVPPSLSVYYDLEDTFTAVTRRKCSVFICENPNLDLQETFQ